MSNPYTQSGFVPEAAAAQPAPDAAPAPSAYTQAGFVAESPPSGPGLWESVGRGAVEGATFGFDNELGVQDAAARERSRAANPWTHFAGEVAGSLAPMMGAMLLPTGATQAAAGARAASLGSRGLGLIRSALVPGEMNTARQAALQGAKLGAVYGGLSGAGHADQPGDGGRLLGAAIGTGLGGVLGAPLGLAGHGASRLVGAAINRLSPDMRTVLDAATDPNTQGVRDVMRQLGYDNYTMADVQALRTAIRDPANVNRYGDLNLIEALESRYPVQAPTGELRPPVVTSPNLRDMAQDFANTGGQGRQQAVEAFAQRRAEMPGRIASDVDTFFGTGVPLDETVNRFFGTGNRVADEAALDAQRRVFNQRYERLREAPIILTEDLVPVLNSRTMRTALQQAAENDVLMNPASGGRWRWLQDSSGIPPREGEPFILSPSNILDIHHSLVMQAKPPLGGATSESVHAGRFKNWFSEWVDNNLRGHERLRGEYSLFKRQMEAAEHGANLPLNTGGQGHKSLQFLRTLDRDTQNAATAHQKILDRLDGAVGRFDTGARGTAPKDIVTEVRSSQAYQAQLTNVRDAFRKAWGDNILTDLGATNNPAPILNRLLTREGQARIAQILGDPTQAREFTRYVFGEVIKQEIAQARTGNSTAINGIVEKYLTPAGQRRIMDVLGPDEGRQFIESLFNKRAQVGLSNTLFGNSDTAYKLARNKKTDALMDAVHGVFHLRPMQTLGAIREIGSSAYKQRRADQGNALLSQQGIDNVSNILDSMIARNQLQTSGHPYIMNPLVRPWIGPGAAALPPTAQYALHQQRERDRRRRQP